jgi:hypothetical protein
MAGRTLCSWKCHSSKPKDSLIIIKTHITPIYSRSLERKNVQAFCLLQIPIFVWYYDYLNPEFQKNLTFWSRDLNPRFSVFFPPMI